MRTLSFKNVTEAQYLELAQKAQAQGIPISGEKGDASKFGIELTWSHDPDLNSLEISILKHPFFISEDSIVSKLTDMLTVVQG